MGQPKFIITHAGFFRMGNVVFHKDLLQPGDFCIGGGYYEFDTISSRLLLSGESFDFGPPRWSYLDSLKVPSSLRGMTIVYQSVDSFADPFVVSEELQMEYI